MARTQMNLKTLTCSQTNMAKALGITQQRVSQLAKQGVICVDGTNGVLVLESIKNYYKLKNSGGAGTDECGDVVDYDIEKAKSERAKRKIAEIKLAKLERNVYTAKTVELVLTEMLANLRTQLLGIPNKLSPILEGLSKDEIYNRLTGEIEEKLKELSEYNPDLFVDEVDDEE